MSFKKGFEKVAGEASFFNNASKLDKHGLKLLALPTAYHGYKAFKEKDKAGMAAAGTELAGLGMLHHAVTVGH